MGKVKPHKYGKFTVDQLRQMVQMIPEFEKMRADMTLALGESHEKSAPWLQPGLAWAAEYTYPIEIQITRLAEVMGVGDKLIEAANSDDPAILLSNLVDHDDGEAWNGGGNGEFEKHHLLGRLLGVAATFDCLMLYGCYINEFLVLAKDNGDDEALFKAIRVDPVVVTCEFAAHRISVAVAVGDRMFLKGLQTALLGKTGDQAQYLKEFRFLMQFLDESRMLDRPTTELSSLCLEIGAYDDHPNAVKNLSELIRKFRML